MKTKELFVTCAIALKLKKKGFDEPCRDHWERGIDGLGWGLFTSGDWLTYKDLTLEYKDKKGNIYGEFSAPTFDQAFDWLREKHGWNVTIEVNGNIPPFYYWKATTTIERDYKNQVLVGESTFKTHKKACIDCIEKMIKII